MIHTGDCIEVMRGMPEASVDAICTDPPYALEFMGKSWDRFGRGEARSDAAATFSEDGMGKGFKALPSYLGGLNPRCKACGKSQRGGSPCQCERPDFTNEILPRVLAFQAWCQEWATEALRVTKPGGYLLAFGGTRTHHRLVCGLEDAGWIIRDELTWVYACLSDDTEILTDLGWVRYHSANDAKYAAAFNPATGELRWERIRKVHRYEHDGPMVEVGPSLVTLNHRVIIDEATARVPHLPRLWDELPAGVGMGEAGPVASLLPSMQRETADTRSSIPTGARVERRATAVATREDDGLRESGLEGRRYRVQEARELLWGSIRARTSMGEADGPERRLHHGAPSTARRALRLLANALRVRQPREPRPDRQSSREPDALAGQSNSQAVRARQGDRGDRLQTGIPPRLVDYFGYVWCITVPSGAFVARRNGVAFVTGNSGFPKGRANLKPAHEPIVLARKPGPLQMLAIDECRIGDTVENWPTSRPYAPGGNQPDDGTRNYQSTETGPTPPGRWPSNVLLQDAELFDEPTEGVVGSGSLATTGGSVQTPRQGGFGGAWSGESAPFESYGDVGGYSRFFIVPKADRSDREPVIRGQLATNESLIYSPKEQGPLPQQTPSRPSVRENAHPTVKPVDLMRHLIRLVTPRRGLILDPFAGSGSTLIAAELEGFPWIGIEKEPEYVAIAEARLNGTQRGLGLDVGAPMSSYRPPAKMPPIKHDQTTEGHWESYRPGFDDYSQHFDGTDWKVGGPETDEEPAA